MIKKVIELGYEPPKIEFVELNVENGFAASSELFSLSDYDSLSEDEEWY